MVRDRSSCILIRLAATGQLARVPGDIRSPQWWQLTNWLAQEQTRQDQIRLDELKYIRNFTLRTCNLTDESRKAFEVEEEQVHQRLLNAVYPWSSKTVDAEARVADDTRLMQSWEKYFGQLSDPDTQARIAATAVALARADRSQGRRRR